MSTVRVARHIRGSRAAVYRALLDPQAIAVWRVPPGMTSVVHHIDASEGGSFRISLTYAYPNGTGKTNASTDMCHGRFARLVPDTQVVEVIEFETTDPDLRAEMTMTTSLADAAGGTDVVVVHERMPAGVAAADDELGTRLALDNLARLVESSSDQPPGESRYFAVTTVRGPNWDDTRPIRAQERWEEHASFFDGLVDDGFVVLGGPIEDGDHVALLLVDATDEEEVRRRFAPDPWAAMGVLGVGSVKRWSIWLDARGQRSQG